MFNCKLKEDNIQITTHQLHQEKDLEIILRGVLEVLSDEDIKRELENKKIPVRIIYRVQKGDKIWPLVLVPLDAKSSSVKSVFNLTHLKKKEKNENH